MAPPLFAKPCVVVLTIAVAVSRLMSTNGRAIRLQQQQQHQQPTVQRHHLTGLEDGISYSDPELDIDRLYELINDNRASDRIQQHPHRQLLKPRPPPSGQAAASAAVVADISRAAAAVAAAEAGPALSLHQPASPTTDSQQQQQHQQPVNQSTAAHAAQPRYHFEVHSVQHTGQPFQTAEQKLRTVIRQMAAVQYHLHDIGDGKQTLLDDNELHQKRLAAAKKADSNEKSSPKPNSGKVIAAAAAEARYLIEQEQLRQLQEQEQRYYDDGELDDEEMQEPYDPEAEMAAPQPQPLKLDNDEVDKRPKQNTAGEGKATPGESGDRRQPSVTREQEVGSKSNEDDDASQPLALPVKSDGDIFDRSSLQGSAGSPSSIADIYFLAVVVGCAVAGIAGFTFAGLCWYRLHRKMKEAGDVDYPAYGVTGPASSTTRPGGVVTMPGGTAGSPGDRKLAQSAQMYHYQHQKQQMIASERLSSDVNQQGIGGTASDVESEEENEDGDYTVFECPGLATNGEMEVRNPMFNDPTPVGTPADTAGLYGQTKK